LERLLEAIKEHLIEGEDKGALPPPRGRMFKEFKEILIKHILKNCKVPKQNLPQKS